MRIRELPPQLPRSGTPELLVVGEAPCDLDIRNGGVFTAQAGRMLDQGLRAVGLDRSQCYLTNLFTGNLRFADRKGAYAEAAKRLRDELSQWPGTPAITFDSLPLRAVVEWPKATAAQAWRGSVARVYGGKEGGRIVLPMLSPIEVTRAERWKLPWQRDWERAARLRDADWLWLSPEDREGHELVICSDLEQYANALRKLRTDDVSFDVETLGLGPTKTPLVCFGISDGSTTVVVPWASNSSGQEPYWPDGGRAVAHLTSATLANRLVVTHNGPMFDHIVAARYDIRIKRWADTLYLTHVLEGHMPKNLPYVVTNNEVDALPWKHLEARGSNLPALMRYNGRDCLYSILAYRNLAARMSAVGRD